MLQTVWNELDYRIDVCRITKGAHIEHLQGMEQKLGVLFCEIENTYTPISSVLCMTSC